MTIFKLMNLRNLIVKAETICGEKELSKRKEFLKSFREPKTLYERSFYQYKCQQYLYRSSLVSIIENVAARILTTRFIENCKKNTYKKTCVKSETPVAVYFNSLGMSIVPRELKALYNILYVPQEADVLLLEEDIIFINTLRKLYPKEYYFVFKNICKIAQYRALIEKYSPDAIIATCEYSFASSILTLYCNNNGVKHINIEHGEKFFCLTSTFFSFNECYVWEQHYVDLFKKLRADPEQFKISVPDSILMDLKDIEPTIDYKYYLQIESLISLLSVRKILSTLKSNGYKVKVRPHPLHMYKLLLKRLFCDDDIEKPSETDIRSSVGECKTVIAKDSSVIYQAYMSGREVVIDDVTEPKQAKTYEQMDYFMYTQPGVKLLSHELEKMKEK